MAQIRDYFKNSYEYVRDNVQSLNEETGIVKGFWGSVYVASGTGLALISIATSIELYDGGDPKLDQLGDTYMTMGAVGAVAGLALAGATVQVRNRIAERQEEQ